MRLRKVERPDNEWQKCCRYCHWYSSGKCYNERNTIEDKSIELCIYGVSENGYLSDTLEEFLMDESLIKPFRMEVMRLLDKWGVSQKRKKEFEDEFKECWEQFATVDLKEKLDERVLNCFLNHFDTDSDGIPIGEPDTYSCQYWE